MHRLLHISMAVLVVTLLAPVVICVVPGNALNPGSECCKHMSAECNRTDQLSSCCAISVSDIAISSPVGKMSANASQVEHAVTADFPVLSEVRIVQQAMDPAISSFSPPPLLPGHTTVLRI